MGVLLLLTALVQSPADRASIESLRDSLAGVTDTVALHALEAATIAVAKERRNDPLIHIRLGFIGYRLGETTKTKSHYDDAAGEFEWARTRSTRLNSSHGYILYAVFRLK